MSDFEQRLRAGLHRVADEAHEPFDPAGQVRSRITRRASRRRARLAAGAVVATLAVGGGTLVASSAARSGGSDVVGTQDLEGRTVLAAAVDETAAAGSFRFETTVSGLGGAIFGGGSGGTAAEPAIKAQGTFDYGTHQGRVTTQLPPSFPAGGEDVEVVLDRSAIYVRLPGSFGGFLQLPEGKQWVKANVGEHDRAEDGVFGSLFSGADPTSALDRLRQEGATVEQVGREEVRGVPTTRYRFHLDEAPAASDGHHGLAGEVWVDDEGRLRRVTTAAPAATGDEPAGAAQPGGEAQAPFLGDVTTTTDFFDFGAAVDVAPPPAEQVADVSQLAFSQLGHPPGERD